MRITKADKADLQTILNLQYDAYQSEAELLNNFDIPPLTQTYDEIVDEYEKGIFLKAVNPDGTIVGSVRAYTYDGTGFIGKLIVHPKRQGQGIGTALMYAIEHECGTARYELFTSIKSIKNIRLYKRLGYMCFTEKRITDELAFVYMEKRK